jgi:CelD/BcsL family acetyltransferase involved in cellulose biosynthesis
MIGEAERIDDLAHVAEDASISTELIIGTRAFMSLEADWKGLFEASNTQNPFLSWEWIATWAQHFCGDRLRTVVVRRDRQAIAIAPFHLNRYLIGPGVYTRALQLLGPKEVQHLFEIREMLIHPHHEQQAMAAVFDRALQIPGWDWMELSAQGQALAALNRLLELQESHGFAVHVEPTAYMPVLALESTWDGQRQKLKRNIKESIRHCYNSLRRDNHEPEYVADGGPSAAEAAERLVELHHRRSEVTGRRWHRNHFADDSIRAFQLDVLARMHAAGRVRFGEISVGGQVVAARACMEAHGGLYLYYSGFDPAWWKYSVMTLVVTEAIKDAIARGRSTVNFSPGVDESKSRWGPELIPMQTFTVVRANPLAQARFRLLRVRKRIRQPLHRQLDRAIGMFRRPPATGQVQSGESSVPSIGTSAQPQTEAPSVSRPAES